MTTSNEFVAIASRYCSLIENLERVDAFDFPSEVREILPLLYYHGLRLPDVPATEIEIVETKSHDEWKPIYDSISERLNVNDLYWGIFEPLTETPEPPVCTTISDDLADIWRDLKSGLEQWHTAGPIEKQEITWQWRFLFKHHWSKHLLNALRTLNCLLEPDGMPKRKFDG